MDIIDGQNKFYPVKCRSAAISPETKLFHGASKIQKLAVRIESRLPANLKELRQIIRQRAHALILESDAI